MLFVFYLVIAVGVAVYFWDGILHLIYAMRRNYKTYFYSALHWCTKKLEKNQSLKTKVMHLNNGKKENLFSRSYNTMSEILATTGEKSKEKQMRIISLICAGVGAVIAVYLRSYMLLPILAGGLGLLPMWLIKFKLFRYRLRMQNELSVVLSMVTNSYIRNENIVEAVSENLTYMNEPCKSIFQSFVYASRQVNPNPQKNIDELKQKIDNDIFKLWCDSLRICQNDINQKASLNAIVEQFATEKELYNMLSTEISAPMRTFITIALISGVSFPLTAMIGHQLQIGKLLDILFTTFIGQSIVVGYVITLLVGFNKAITLSTSME